MMIMLYFATSVAKHDTRVVLMGTLKLEESGDVFHVTYLSGLKATRNVDFARTS